MMTALSSWWMVGWVVGAVVVALVAILLLTITALARKTDKTAKHLVSDLDSIAQKTEPLRDVSDESRRPDDHAVPADRPRRRAGP